MNATPTLSHVDRKARRRKMAECVRTGRTLDDVAREFGVCITTVQIACRLYGVKRKNAYVQRIKREREERWASVDWTRRDTEIAKAMGVTRERARQLRKRIGKPRANDHHRTSAGVRGLEWLRGNRRSASGMTLAEIEASAPVKLTKGTWSRLKKHVGVLGRKSFAEILTADSLLDFCTVTESGCWEWNGCRNKITRYPLAGKAGYVHRLAYELFIGEIPSGLNVMHSCDNPPCVNPRHLYIGTDADNVADREAKGRGGAGKMNYDKACLIRKKFESGNHDYPALASEFHVNPSTVYRIVTNKTWREPSRASA